MKRTLLLILVLLCCVTRVEASVAVDSREASNAGHTLASSPGTWNFTNGAGTLLVCGFDISELAGSPSISAVSYNSVAMTLVDSYLTGTPVIGFDGSLLAFYYLNGGSLATGSNAVSVTFAYAGTTGTNKGAIGGCISFTGADPTVPFGTAAKNKDTTSGTATSGTVNVPSSTSGNIIIGIMNTGSGSIATTAPSTTSWLLNASTHTAADNAALSEQAAGGSINMAWTFTADAWSGMAVEVKATAGGGGGCTPTMTLMGVGRCGH